MELTKIAYRLYRCRECSNEVQLQTNHRLDCYPTCQKCKTWHIVGRGVYQREVGIPRQTAHEFIRDLD